MSGTRAFVAKQIKEGVIAIYTQWDGYPKHHGRILLDHYSSEEEIDELFALGDLSTLGIELGEKHRFNTGTVEYPDWCLAYGRDRGDKDSAAKTYSTMGLMLNIAEDLEVQYIYLWRDGVWRVHDRYGDEGGKFHELCD